MEINFPWYAVYARKDGKNSAPFPIMGIKEKPSAINQDGSLNREVVWPINEKLAISFTPNWWFRWNEDRKRTKDLAKNINCIAVDADGNNTKWMEFPLKPNRVVKTKNGYHVYWILENPVSYSSHKDDYHAIMEAMVVEFGADWQARDISRMMRLPWSSHKKDPNDHFPIEVIHFEENGKKYKFQDFVDMSRCLIVDKKLYSKTTRSVKWDSWKVFDSIAEVPVIDVLAKFESIDTNGRDILIDWRRTWWYKYNKTYNYLFAFSGNKWGRRPSWPPFSVAKHFLGSSQKVFNFFKSEFWIQDSYKQKKVVPKKTNIFLNDDGKLIKKWEIEENKTYLETEDGVKVMKDTEIEMSDNKYIFSYDWEEVAVESSNSIKTIMDWFIQCVGSYEENWVLNSIMLIKKNWITHTLNFSKLSSKNALEKALSEKNVTFFWSEEEARDIISIIHSNTNTMIYANKLWIYSNGLIINKTWEYIKKHDDQWYYCNINTDNEKKTISNKILVKRNKTSFSLKKGKPVNTKNEVINIIERCCEFQDRRIIVWIFSLISMWMFMSIFRDLGLSVPWVLVCWTVWAGKTTTIDLLWEICWITIENIQANWTQFILDSAAWHYIVHKLAEYKTNWAKTDLNTFLKNSYDGTPSPRGRKDGTRDMYPSNAMRITDWEGKIMDPAVLSRNLSFTFTKAPKEKVELFRKAKEEWILNTNVLPYLYSKIDSIIEIQDKIPKRTKLAEKEAEPFAIPEKARMSYNIWVVLAFLECVDLINEFKQDIIDWFTLQMRTFWDSKIDKVIKQTLIKAIHDKSPINCKDNVFEVTCYMDMSKIDVKKMEDIQGNIAVANMEMNGGEESLSNDTLYIPYDFIFSKKTNHWIFNSLLNSCESMYHQIEFTDEARKKIINYARKNRYQYNSFYTSIIEHARDHI